MGHASSTSIKLAVGEFAQLVQNRGDLGRAQGVRVSTREGQDTHRRLQAVLAAEERAEVAIAHSFRAAGLRLTLSGRVDLLETHPEGLRIDEIKTSRTPPITLLAQTDHSHWQQLLTYAALFALKQPNYGGFHLRLRYVHPDTLAEQVQERRYDRQTVLTELSQAVSVLARRLSREYQRQRARDRSLLSLAFPYPAYRPQQRALIRTVEQSLEAGQPLLVEAATGLGKSLGVLFPVLRALPRNRFRQIWYLTAKRTGRLAAHRAAAQFEAQGAQIRWLELTARSQSCPNPELPCDPAVCEFAAGFYDRVGAAERSLLKVSALTPATVQQVALKHRVCPYALTRRLRHQVDLVIADFNSALDPHAPSLVPDYAALLIDEAHQLVPRVRELLSARLSPTRFRAALGEAESPRQRQLLRRCLALIERAVLDGPQAALVPSWLDQLARTVEQLLADEPALTPGAAVSECIWSLQRWLKLCELEALRFQALLEDDDGVPGTISAIARETSVKGASTQSASTVSRPARNGKVLHLLCLDPGPHIAERLKPQPFSVRFSGTLTPPGLYQQQQGLKADNATRIASPYESAALRLLVVHDLPVYWRQRAQSLPKLTELLMDLTTRQPGIWLIGVPSFTYLEQLRASLEICLEDQPTATAPKLLVQQRSMDTVQRETFMSAMAAARDNALVLVVQGGVFAESVDFSGLKLKGVCAVGVGLAPPNTARQAICAHYDQLELPGHTLAYAQPAMERIVQLVGRLQRDPDDRGIALLIDDRFRSPAFQQFFPSHWRPRPCRARAVSAALADWQVQDESADDKRPVDSDTTFAT